MLPSGIHGIPIDRKSNLPAKDDKMVAHGGRDETKLGWDVELRGEKGGENSVEVKWKGEVWQAFCAFRRQDEKNIEAWDRSEEGDAWGLGNDRHIKREDGKREVEERRCADCWQKQKSVSMMVEPQWGEPFHGFWVVIPGAFRADCPDNSFHSTWDPVQVRGLHFQKTALLWPRQLHPTQN